VRAALPSLCAGERESCRRLYSRGEHTMIFRKALVKALAAAVLCATNGYRRYMEITIAHFNANVLALR
jgi:hypothetical protein